ncbi:MAG: hypothetical protein ACLP19_02050 [Xanthobacteraceae bacterium]
MLLDDAIHSMTAYRGIGANIALKGAVRLCRALTAANFGQRPLLDAIHAYETDVIDYGLSGGAHILASHSLQAMEQAMPESRIRLALSRAFLRTVNRVPSSNGCSAP